ncbi:MAG: twin-arginine translocase subunit TatC [Fidelibacterota bacterium]
MSPVSRNEMPFLDHLEELRWRIIKSLLGIVVGSVITFLFIDQIFELLKEPAASIENLQFQALTPYAMFMLKWGIALVGGVVIAIPVLTFQTWKFVTPGLLKNERKYILPVIIFTFISFLAGVLFAYYIMLPFTLQFFTSMTIPEVQNNFSINSYVSYVLWILLAAGILFELPVLVLILSTIGLITPPFMKHYRRHAILFFVILSAFITPPDPISLIIMTLPLVLLYEISIFISKLFMKRFDYSD